MTATEIDEPQRRTAVFGEADVVVVGAGAAGICAAAAAARTGAQTLLIDSAGYPGGTAADLQILAGFTDGRKQIVWGIADELLQQMRGLGGFTADPARDRFMPFDAECFKFAATDLLTGAGVEMLFHAFAVDAIVSDDSCQGVIVETKGGRRAVPAGIVVDCSGDADVAHRAGVPCKIGRDADGGTQPMTMIFSVGGVDVEMFEVTGGYEVLVETFTEIAEAEGFENPRRGELSGMFEIPGHPGQVVFNATRVLDCLGTDPEALTRASLAGRRQVREFVYDFLRPHVPGFENAYLASTATRIGIRETRRILGRRVMAERDVTEYREQKDVIGRGAYPVDIHSPDGAGTDFRQSRHVAGRSYALPYGMLVPRDVDKLLVAGRCVSATHVALSAIRVIGCCMAMGQAAGTAAGLCAQSGAGPAQLDVAALQNRLLADGVWLGDAFGPPPGTTGDSSEAEA